MPTGAGPGQAPAAAAAGDGSSSGGGGGGAPSFSRQAAKAFSGTGTDAPASTAVTGAQGGATEGLSQAMVAKYKVAALPGVDALSKKSFQQMLNNPKDFQTKKNSAGETMADQVQYAKQNNLRDVEFRGKFGGSFSHVDGLAPHQSDNTPMQDRTIPGDPEGFGALAAKGLASVIGGPIGAVSTLSSLVDLSQGLQDPISKMLGLPTFFKSTTPTTPTAPPKSTAPSTSLPKPKVKPTIELAQGRGPSILKEIKKKKGGRIKKKNYSKGGGVRSANY